LIIQRLLNNLSDANISPLPHSRNTNVASDAISVVRGLHPAPRPPQPHVVRRRVLARHRMFLQSVPCPFGIHGPVRRDRHFDAARASRASPYNPAKRIDNDLVGARLHHIYTCPETVGGRNRRTVGTGMPGSPHECARQCSVEAAEIKGHMCRCGESEGYAQRRRGLENAERFHSLLFAAVVFAHKWGMGRYYPALNISPDILKNGPAENIPFNELWTQSPASHWMFDSVEGDSLIFSPLRPKIAAESTMALPYSRAGHAVAGAVPVLGQPPVAPVI
jgi:hypothetical protein